MKIKLLLLFMLAGVSALAQSQGSHRCVSWERQQKRMEENPAVRLRMQLSEQKTQAWLHKRATMRTMSDTVPVIRIPVVVHVVYNTSTQNISDAQIKSQIDVLNADYRRLNADTTNTPSVWKKLGGDSKIEFCLAIQDPDNNVTTGITRTNTTVTSFADPNMDNVKFSAKGGIDNWDPTKYLNIWVCTLANKTLGYATFPTDLGDSPELDGVVIDYRVFGTTGTVGTGTYKSYNLGRTATHEVGHWLNLRHIWGDGDDFDCGDDLVADTPPANEANYGVPTFPDRVGYPCTTDTSGQMFMNYMDYSDDKAMNMFTIGQGERMQAAISTIRTVLPSLALTYCSQVSALSAEADGLFFTIAPNPANGYVVVNGLDITQFTELEVVDLAGKVVYRSQKYIDSIDVSQWSKGLYAVKLVTSRGIGIKKLLVAN